MAITNSKELYLCLKYPNKIPKKNKGTKSNSSYWPCKEVQKILVKIIVPVNPSLVFFNCEKRNPLNKSSSIIGAPITTASINNQIGVAFMY